MHSVAIARKRDVQRLHLHILSVDDDGDGGGVWCARPDGTCTHAKIEKRMRMMTMTRHLLFAEIS